jgi:hypothetical protein
VLFDLIGQVDYTNYNIENTNSIFRNEIGRETSVIQGYISVMVPKIRVSLARRNASKREKLVTGFVIMSAMVFLWIGGTSGT